LYIIIAHILSCQDRYSWCDIFIFLCHLVYTMLFCVSVLVIKWSCSKFKEKVFENQKYPFCVSAFRLGCKNKNQVHIKLDKVYRCWRCTQRDNIKENFFSRLWVSEVYLRPEIRRSSFFYMNSFFAVTNNFLWYTN
jgi:hypothetical protein